MISPEEDSVYVSKVALGPLAPPGSSVPRPPPTLRKKVQGEAGGAGPQMATFLPSCPRSSGTPGVAALHQSPRAWPEVGGALVQELCSRGRPPGLSPVALGHHGGRMETGSSALSCTGSGSPWSSDAALLVSTCPQVSTGPGLPSVQRSDPGVWDGRCLWGNRPEPEEPLRSLSRPHADSDTLQVPVALLPTCPRRARSPGFPSAGPPQARGCPSMAGLLPTCPTQTAVAGMPCRARVALPFRRWHVLPQNRLLKPQRRSSVLAQDPWSPSCPWEAGSPEEPHFIRPSMVDFVPACPRRSRVLGLPSKESLSYQSQTMNTSLTEGGSDPAADSLPGVSDSDRGQISHMAAMLPSCPVRTGLLGMPSRSLRPLSRSGQVSMSTCVESPRPGAGSPRVSEARDYPAFRPVSQGPGQTTLGGTADMSASCPVFGLASARRQDACMADLLPSCPGCSRICGLPSKATQAPGACQGWLASTETPLGGPFIPRGVPVHSSGPSWDGGSVQATTATRPSCPLVACVPGLPAALRLPDGPKMVNPSHGFSGGSGVPGMSPGPRATQMKWTVDRNSLLSPRRRSTFPLADVLMAGDGGGIVEPSRGKPDPSRTGPRPVVVPMSPSRPNRSNITGIPSKESPRLLGAHLASAAAALGVASKHVLCSGPGGPAEDALRGTLGTEVVGKDKGELLKQRVSQREDRRPQTLVLEGSVQTSVPVGQTFPALTAAEISWTEEESEGRRTGAGFWTPREEDDAAALGRG